MQKQKVYRNEKQMIHHNSKLTFATLIFHYLVASVYTSLSIIVNH